MRPMRALVRPRVLSPFSGEVLLLEDEVLARAERGERGVVWVVGGPGSGKMTALAHLAAILPKSAKVAVQTPHDPLGDKGGSLVVTCTDSDPGREGTAYRLAPWTDDELIEYLLAAHRNLCASVMRRCESAAEKNLLLGIPELWRYVLDALAVDESIPTVKDALRRVLDQHFAAAKVRELAGSWCLAILQQDAEQGAAIRSRLEPLCDFAALLRLLTHAPVVLLLAADQVADELRRSARCDFLGRPLLRELIAEAAMLIRQDAPALECLQSVLAEKRTERHPMAASLLHAAGIGWRPKPIDRSLLRKLVGRRKLTLPSLHGAFLQNANWPGISLTRMDLRNADLSGADLREANLDSADAWGVKLAQSKLTGASMEGLYAQEANLSGADCSYVRASWALLRGAECQGASFEGAMLLGASLGDARLCGARFTRGNLARAELVGADIEGADFSQADFESAALQGLVLRLAEFRRCSFHRAILRGCDLEGMDLPGVNFSRADLKGALLTATKMPGADFRGAKLVHTGLAEIDWEGADLREADLTEASFHMGSSRSGLVDSPIASYGSRTGFYTDDFNEQDFKPPEEIRKANLRGADLRGAKVEGVDFYLVDLREARYSNAQEQHFRGCGAILESRVE